MPPTAPPTDIVLVTGAASGIGRATALAFAARGAQVIACDVDAVGLDALASELGPRCLFTRVVDVADRAEMKALADEVHARVPAVDVLVNNAGVALHGGILDTSLDDWDWLLGVNLRGVIHGCHFFVPPMVARGRGHVVNVSSTYGFVGGTRVLAYVTSKFGVFGLSESLRAELRDKGVGVSTICPGMIKTNIVRRARFNDPNDGGAHQEHAVRLFDRRGARPETVARAIVRAVERRRVVVPVAAEAWLLYGLKRAAPRLTSRVVALLDAWRARQALAGRR